ncbi:MAG: thermonuclease family protein [Gammaproteobacteria bacterium]
MARKSNPGPIPGFKKGAPVERLFYCLLSCLLFIPGVAPAADSCAPGSPDSRVTIEYVIDGDTVILGDDTHLRLVGIDTPEIDHKESDNTEPGAVEARRFLNDLLDSGEHLLVLDEEHEDRHGRLLGHLFLNNGTNVQARLLAEGRAVPLVIPPNLRFLDCYQAAAESARKQGRGLWGQPRYQALEAAELDAGTRGYRVIEGTVTRIGKSRTSIWVNLGDGFALRILRGDLPRFTDPDIESLKGRRIQARGRVYRRNNQLRIQIRHPADLFVLPLGEGNR